MKEYRVEFTEKENGYLYTGEWNQENVDADYEEEAIEFIKSYLNENGEDADNFIYRTR